MAKPKETEQEIVNRIMNTQGKMAHHLKTHNSILVGVSGGSDSDCIVHMIATYFREYLPKIHFVFSDTGLEYKATKEHLKYIEEKYDIKIKRLSMADGVVPVPVAVKKYGVPLISKFASEQFEPMTRKGFKFEDKPVDELLAEYDKMKRPIKWWCNALGEKINAPYNIGRNKWLKEFLIQNPPKFAVSAKCCTYSKKKPMSQYEDDCETDLVITGMRKAEGGVRASSVKDCYTADLKNGRDKYNPLFFWSDDCKQYYKEHEGIRYSDCYEIYGLRRTGCVGCPFNRKFNEELEVMKKYEPKLYNACVHVFGDAYDFTAKYRQFQKECKDAETERKLKLKVKGE